MSSKLPELIPLLSVLKMFDVDDVIKQWLMGVVNPR